MKITIEPEGEETIEKKEISGVYQFTMGGWFYKDGLFRDYFMWTHINNRTELLMLLRGLEENIKNYVESTRES